MVSKCLELDNVSLVGVKNADTIMNYRDLRSHERAFKMMVQVAGRAGRRKQRGEVIIQTTDPEATLIKQIIRNDYKGMYEVQLRERKRFCYPPFYRLIYIYLKHKNESILSKCANYYAAYLRSIFGERILGPDNPPVARMHSLHIRKIMIKIENEASITKAKNILEQSLNEINKNRAEEQTTELQSHTDIAYAVFCL